MPTSVYNTAEFMFQPWRSLGRNNIAQGQQYAFICLFTLSSGSVSWIEMKKNYRAVTAISTKLSITVLVMQKEMTR